MSADGLQSGGSAQKKLQTAEISLNDCLACRCVSHRQAIPKKRMLIALNHSGCITSAESVLISMQSHTEVLNFLANNPEDICVSHKVPVISIAPQTLASLATSISSSSTSAPVSLHRILRRVESFCKSVLGFEHVFDTTFARHLALLEHIREYRERKNSTGQLPMLASACPGWVCYAEKTHAEMLPFISRTKSPQQVMGSLVKDWMASKWHKRYAPDWSALPASITLISMISSVVISSVPLPPLFALALPVFPCSPSQIYHVTVMPCYDKKLEASRQDFYNEIYSTRDVDCVITTGELELMMREKNWDLSIPVDGEDTDEEDYLHRVSSSSSVAAPTSSSPRQNQNSGSSGGDAGSTSSDAVDVYLPELINHPGTSSGSYLHSLIRAVADEHPCALDLNVRAVRSSDYEEYTLTERTTGSVVFRGAKCYGFRNLQNLVRKVGRDAGVQVGRGAAGKMALRGRGLRAKKAGGDASADKGYDYVEVMACPGGCVNGGGQLRPAAKAQAGTDEEGFKRDWEAEGVKLDGEDIGRIQGQSAKWGDKEWTKKVEVVYWHDLPTPPPSPTPEDEGKERQIVTRIVDEKTEVADRLAVHILREACKPETAQVQSWTESMDDKAESRRQKLFRTQYHAVESEVIGLAVKW